MRSKNKLLLLGTVLSVLVVLVATTILTVAVCGWERKHRRTMDTVFLLRQTDVALWRLDTYLSGVVTVENARGAADYSAPFAQTDKLVRGFFYVRPDGSWQLTGRSEDQAEFAALSEELAKTFPVGKTVEELNALLESLPTAPLIAAAQTAQTSQSQEPQKPQETQETPEEAFQNAYSPTQELNQRRQIVVQNVQAFNSINYSNSINFVPSQHSNEKNKKNVVSDTNITNHTNDSPFCPLTPVWSGDNLLLVRKISMRSVPELSQTSLRRDKNSPFAEILAGLILDREVLQTRLREQIADLFPQARFEPVNSNPSGQLTALPLRLIPGSPSNELVLQMNQSVPNDLTWGLLTAVWGLVLFAIVPLVPLVWGLVQMSQRREQFVAAVSHELRTPLTTFRIYTEMLEEDLLDEPQRRQYIATLAQQASRLSAMLENVMAVSRIYRGKRVEPIQTIELVPWLTEVVERLRLRIERTGFLLETEGLTELSDDSRLDAPPVLPAVLVAIRPQALEQVLANLVDNSVKYANSASAKRIVLSARREIKTVVLTVRDFGPGFPQTTAIGAQNGSGNRSENQNRFRFWRKTVEQAAQSRPGLGLGLPLSVELLKSFRARLRIVPAEQGAVVEITIPKGKNQERGVRN